MAIDPSPLTDTTMPNRERPRLVIVDAHGHAFRAFHALAPMQAPDGLPTNALFGLAGMLRRIVMEERPDRVAVVFDDADGQRRTFRSTLYPAYKAHRPERPEALARQIPLMRELTRAFGLEALEHPDFEADDLIATLVIKAEAEGFETTILAADKDLMQLVSERTTLWDSMRGKRYTPAAVHEKLGVPTRLVPDYLALIGDTSDNVPGVSGIGPKGASKLLEAHGSLAGIYDHLALVSPRERARLEASRDLAFLSLELTRLRNDVPLDVSLDDLALYGFDLEPLQTLADRLGFRVLSRESREPHLGRLAALPRRPTQPISPLPVSVPAAPLPATPETPSIPSTDKLQAAVEVELQAAVEVELQAVEVELQAAVEVELQAVEVELQAVEVELQAAEVELQAAEVELQAAVEVELQAAEVELQAAVEVELQAPLELDLQPQTLAALRSELETRRPAMRLAEGHLTLAFPSVHFALRLPEAPRRRSDTRQGDLFAPRELDLADISRILRDALGEAADRLHLDVCGVETPALAHFATLASRGPR